MASSDHFAVDGFDGGLYDYIFPVPTYDTSAATFSTLSWRDIDLYYESNASSAVLNAVGFTICLVSFLYVIALTPSNKRRFRIHTFLVLALVFKMIDRGIALSLLLHSPNVSSYINLTLDVSHVIISNGFKARVAALQVGAVLTFACLQACLYIHGKPLLTFVRLSYKMLYHILLTSLIMAGLLGVGLRIALAVMILVNLDEPLGPSGSQYQAVYHATIITFAVSIASWSLVFFCSSINILVQRRKQLVSRNRIYESVLNMIAIVGLESFILPLAIAILQLVPRINIILSNSPEVLLIPSVLLVLPLASVFGSSRAGQLPSTASTEVDKYIHRGDDSTKSVTSRTYQTSSPKLQYDDLSHLDGNVARVNLQTPKATPLLTTRSMGHGQHPLDIELRRIDEMAEVTVQKGFV